MAHITATRRPASDLTEGYPVPQCEERARLHLATYMYQTRCSLVWSTNSFVHQPVYSVRQVYESGVCSTSCTTSGTTSGTPGTLQFHFQLLATLCHTSMCNALMCSSCTHVPCTLGTPGTRQLLPAHLSGAPCATPPCVMHPCALFMHPCAMHHLCSLCIHHLTHLAQPSSI